MRERGETKLTEIGALAELDVRHRVHVLEDTRLHRLARERLPRGSADEFECSRSGHDRDVVPTFREKTKEQSRFVAGDAPRHTENDAHRSETQASSFSIESRPSF